MAPKVERNDCILWRCECGQELFINKYLPSVFADNCTMYDSDPAAWDEGLFDAIAADGMSELFSSIMADMLNIRHIRSHTIIWVTLRATLAQKARALAKAIEESK